MAAVWGRNCMFWAGRSIPPPKKNVLGMNTDLWVIFYAHVFVNGVVMIDKCCLMFPAGGFSIPENELFLHV